MIKYYLKLGFVVTFVYLYLLFCSSRNDSHYVPKVKRRGWSNAMITAISKVAYSTGSKIMQVAEWLIAPSEGSKMREYARIKRLKHSMIRIK
jgi:hypothetical protein